MTKTRQGNTSFEASREELLKRKIVKLLRAFKVERKLIVESVELLL